MRPASRTGPARSLFYLSQGLLAISSFWVAAYLAWTSLSAADFMYPLWYRHLDIGATITYYGPRNLYKRGFEDTTAAERARLFGEIVDAVNEGGVGLEAIRYRDPQGRTIDRLLRPAEVVHLRDVADLVSAFRGSAYGALLVLVVLVLGLRRARVVFSIRRALGAVGAILGLAALTVIALGPVEVFYALHRAVFPAQHQWFFYYEESLMTMLMKAPDIFGYIALALVVLTGVFFAPLLGAVRLTLRRGAGDC